MERKEELIQLLRDLPYIYDPFPVPESEIQRIIQQLKELDDVS